MGILAYNADMPTEDQGPVAPPWPGAMVLFVEVPGGWLAWTGDHADWVPCGWDELEIRLLIQERLNESWRERLARIKE